MEVFTLRHANIGRKIRVLHFAGYLNDLAGAEIMAAAEAALREQRTGIIIAFDTCPAISSPGLASLMEVMMRVVDDYHGTLVFTGLDQGKLNLMSVIGLYPMVPHAASLEEAQSLIPTG